MRYMQHLAKCLTQSKLLVILAVTTATAAATITRKQPVNTVISIMEVLRTKSKVDALYYIIFLETAML